MVGNQLGTVVRLSSPFQLRLKSEAIVFDQNLNFEIGIGKLLRMSSKDFFKTFCQSRSNRLFFITSTIDHSNIGDSLLLVTFKGRQLISKHGYQYILSFENTYNL